MDTLGKRLKYLRTRLDLKQKDVAKKLNIQQPTYNYYENDKRLPDINTIKKMCCFFNTSADFLLGLSNNATPQKNDKNLYTILNSNNDLIFDDITISENEKEIILDAIKHTLKIIKKLDS